MIVIDIIKELKALIILIFCIFSVFFVKDSYMLILLGVISAFLLGLSFYIRVNGLIISKNIFRLIIAIVNVFTLLFVIQYLIQGEITSEFLKRIFAIFIKTDQILFYGGWLFSLTSGLIILEKLGGGKSGR
ncbi:hypothetical protein [uncultured Anaerococcus sp.]|uniref:hypothetical protein n=1 Tax=uncultured Anaerococcus sp. TaxID=293428 RepID=UPI00288BB0FF|nr:hypothetical protein [uncultured Anaerococcus sp.]